MAQLQNKLKIIYKIRIACVTIFKIFKIPILSEQPLRYDRVISITEINHRVFFYVFQTVTDVDVADFLITYVQGISSMTYVYTYYP